MKEVDSISDHPAVIAWRKIDPHAGIPNGIDILKERKKSKVFRLMGIGPENLTIVAKGGQFENLRTEQLIYQKILPDCPLSSLECYGFVKNDRDDFHWLFLEDARGEAFDGTNKQHRMAAMQWLGALHTSLLSDEKISLLPDRSIKCYYDYLQKARKNISESVRNPKLTGDQIWVLKFFLIKLDTIASKWEHIKSCFAPIPSSFVHADFQPQNFEVRRIKSKITLIPFDWEMGGWGIPFIDLGNVKLQASEDELWTYWSETTQLWTGLNFRDFQHLVKIGRILNLIAFVYWVSLNLHSDWPERSMKRMYVYQKYISDAFKTLEWK